MATNPHPPNERTSLLAAGPDSQYNAANNMEVAVEDDEQREIDPNAFDIMLSRSNSITAGLGIETESQETAMLRGPRTYGAAKRRSSNNSRHRRKSFASTISGEAISEQDEMEEAESKSPYLAGVSVGTFWLIFGNVLASFFVACFDSTIMVSSHPVITSYFHSSNSASWLSTAFLLTSTSFQPIFGRLSDTIGRKRPYVLTMGLFTLATVWCATAQSMTSFILARAACGLGAGGMMSLGSIIISDLVPIEIRGEYQSYVNMVFGAGSALGAALGGAIADHLGWRWEFGVQVPALSLCLLIACLTIPKNLGLAEGVKQKNIWEAMKVFDYWGSLLLTTSITFLILGLNLGGNVFPWSHPFVIASLAIFAVGFPLFLWNEAVVALPIMPLKLISSNPRAGLIMSNAIGAIVVNAVMFNIPLYFQAVLLESATNSGLRLIVSSLASSAVGTATGFLITWTRQLKIWLVAGATLVTIGTICMTFLRRDLPEWAYVLVLIPSAMGQGFMFPGTFMSVLAVSEQAEQAVVTSTLILWRSLGMVMGVATSSLVLQNALYVFLEEKVSGPEKAKVIEEVRASVHAIAKLAQPYQEQVIQSYDSALRATFMVSAVLSVIGLLVVLPPRLPKLGQRK
ncbi:hypothetical protein BP5796_05186 [Coleophoma crateriformis]|uniref:Major facilitator superfamily (MFS) profile domain-containing protein n=1 Tax=Coleophoma crateriformis TaxID=565419 RepID=A0A3D8S2J4_9HELO|nr:hypothetical protein BP5796_05186 [Coleophoma crateriformis]